MDSYIVRFSSFDALKWFVDSYLKRNSELAKTAYISGNKPYVVLKNVSDQVLAEVRRSAGVKSIHSDIQFSPQQHRPGIF